MHYEACALKKTKQKKKAKKKPNEEKEKKSLFSHLLALSDTPWFSNGRDK